MIPELSGYDRAKILRARIKALKSNQELPLDFRLSEIKTAEIALSRAERDVEYESRMTNKVTRASKPLPSESERAAKAWKRIENEKRVK